MNLKIYNDIATDYQPKERRKKMEVCKYEGASVSPRLARKEGFHNFACSSKPMHGIQCIIFCKVDI